MQDQVQEDIKENNISSKARKKSHICPYDDCKKQFTEAGNLKSHIRIHAFSIDFICL